MVEHEFAFTATDGTKLHVYRWSPESSPTAIVQISHGASEHAARYRRLAGVLTAAGYLVVAHDQRGHGRSGSEHGTLGVARPGGWYAKIDDLHALGEHERTLHPGVPLVLLGHSMGSALVQGFLPSWGRELDAVVLSGPPAPITDPAIIELFVSGAAGEAADQPSELFAQVFTGFNQPFVDAATQPNELTGYEWLSRDTDEVRAYVDDPLCGNDVALSSGFVADMLAQGAEATAPDRLAQIPKDLPMYVFAGDQDPVGGMGEGVRALVDAYRALGLTNVVVRLYEGGRHEMLNEVNRDDVQRDLAEWLDKTLG
jgi:alpha-beta hydrolase superfamily lysophospholipase